MPVQALMPPKLVSWVLHKNNLRKLKKRLASLKRQKSKNSLNRLLWRTSSIVLSQSRLRLNPSRILIPQVTRVVTNRQGQTRHQLRWATSQKKQTLMKALTQKLARQRRNRRVLKKWFSMFAYESWVKHDLLFWLYRPNTSSKKFNHVLNSNRRMGKGVSVICYIVTFSKHSYLALLIQ